MRALMPLALLAVMACDNTTTDKTDTTDATDTTDVTDTTPSGTSGDTGKKVELYNIAASITDAGTGALVTEPLCGELLEISEVVLDPKKGELTVLKTATSDKGTITFTDIDIKPDIPMLINLNDCKGAKGKPVVGISSNTGVLPASYQDAKDGETVETSAFIVNPTYLAGLQASLAGVGNTTNLSKAGWLHGLALDSSFAPLPGVTVTCKACEDKKNPFPTYYIDGDPKVGGLLAGAGGINDSTQAGVGQWMVPGAPVSNYSATDTAKKPVTFSPQLGGSFPGSVIITAFIAQ